jgi:UDP:flavonoid glycosyltransferase YjiC (YdhE family)
MRALFVVGNGGLSHLYPLLPLADELRRRGNEVAVAGPARLTAVAEGRGLPVFELPQAPDGSPLVGASAPSAADLPQLERARAAVGRYLADAVHQCDVLRAAAEQWGADVLVREPAAWAAWLAGELLDLPVAAFDYAATPSRLLAAMLGDLFQTARERVGLPPDPTLSSLNRWLHLLVGPPAWFPARAVTPVTHIFRPAPAPDEGVALPGWLDELDGTRPGVYITLGTMYDRTPGILETLFEAVGGLDVRAVLTLGPRTDPADAPVPPPNLRVEPFLPQPVEEALLSRVDAVVCHGGYGSLLSAMRHGLPIVSVPLGNADDPTRLPGLATIGSAVVVEHTRRTARNVERALRRVLTEPGYRAAAQETASSLARLPSFLEAAALVERLTEQHAPILKETV